MSLMLGLIRAAHLELPALELVKNPFFFDYVYPLASTNIYQSGPKFVKMFRAVRSRTRLILGLIGPVLELEKNLFLTLFTL